MEPMTAQGDSAYPVPERWVRMAAHAIHHPHENLCQLCRDDAARAVAPVLADLREQVQAMPGPPYRWVLRDEVLALLDDGYESTNSHRGDQ